MNKLDVFKNSDFKIRGMLIDGEPNFVASDICHALDVSNTSDAIKRLDEDEKGIALTDTPSGRQSVLVVNESGMYSLVFSSRKHSAKKFKKWVTSEVLPSIRKTGSYSTKPILPNFSNPAEAARAWAIEYEEKQKALSIIEENKPKVDFYQAVTGSKDTIDIGSVAKVLNFPNIGRNNLFAILRGKNILMSNNQPYQSFIDRGYFRTIESKFTKPDGSTSISIKTVVYQKGVDFIRKILDKTQND